MSLNFQGYEDIPERTQQTLIDYVERGYVPGSFVQAVLSNNLVESIGRADIQNLQALPSIGKFMYNRMPMNAWGSVDSVQRYLDTFR